MSWRLDQFVAHCGLGMAVIGIVGLLRSLTGPGEHQCCLLFLYPIGGWFISWLLPRGAPGASLAVAVYFIASFPSDAGPTAKSLTTGFSVGLAGGMFVCEAVAAIIRIAQLRKQQSAP